MGKRWKDGYSASVDLYLLVGNQRFGVAQVGPKSLVLDDNQAVIPRETPGRLFIIVDGCEKSYSVFLHDGALPGREEVAYW